MAFTTPSSKPARISVVALSMVRPSSILSAAHSPSAASSARRMKPAMSVPRCRLFQVQTLLEKHLETGQRQFPVATLVQIVRHPAVRGGHSARQQPQLGAGGIAFEQEILDD